MLVSDTQHYVVNDPQDGAGAVPAEPAPCWDDPSQTIVDAANEPTPAEPGPLPFMAETLASIVAALLACTVRVRPINAEEWAPWRVNLDGTPAMQVANYQPGRISLAIINTPTSTGTVYLSRQPASPAGPNTWPLPPGYGLELRSTRSVYACTDAGMTAVIALCGEYDVGASERL